MLTTYNLHHTWTELHFVHLFTSFAVESGRNGNVIMSVPCSLPASFAKAAPRFLNVKLQQKVSPMYKRGHGVIFLLRVLWGSQQSMSNLFQCVHALCCPDFAAPDTGEFQQHGQKQCLLPLESPTTAGHCLDYSHLRGLAEDTEGSVPVHPSKLIDITPQTFRISWTMFGQNLSFNAEVTKGHDVNFDLRVLGLAKYTSLQ